MAVLVNASTAFELLAIKPKDIPLGELEPRTAGNFLIRRYHDSSTIGGVVVPGALVKLFPTNGGIAAVESQYVQRALMCFDCNVLWHRDITSTCWNCGRTERLPVPFPGEYYPIGV
jgi:hypothetical protein